jgi:phage shock protein PspC (stress-responsive transcriptional regulator)/uncharacterized integral membrane protein
MKKLYRSRSDRMLGGVCGGIGAYLGVDATLVRLVFALLAFANGLGVLLYVLLWLITPLEGEERLRPREALHTGADELAERARAMGEELRTAMQSSEGRTTTIIGAALIVVGAIFLLQNLDVPWLRWVRFEILWPLLLIAAGIALLRRGERG